MPIKSKEGKEARLAEIFAQLENTKAILAHELEEENRTYRSNTMSTIFSGLFDETLEKAWNRSFKEELAQEYDKIDDKTLNLCTEKFIEAWKYAFKEQWAKLKDIAEKHDGNINEVRRVTSVAARTETILGRPLAENEKAIVDATEKKMAETFTEILDTAIKDELIQTAGSRTLLLYLAKTIELKFKAHQETQPSGPLAWIKKLF